MTLDKLDVMPIEDLLRRRLAMQDRLRVFVNALNESRQLKRVVLNCTFIDRRTDWLGSLSPDLNLRDVFGQFEKLRKDIVLDISIQVKSWQPGDKLLVSFRGHQARNVLPLPIHGFPSSSQNEYLNTLRHNRTNTSGQGSPALTDQWITLRAWLLASLRSVWVKQKDFRVDRLGVDLQVEFSGLHDADFLALRLLVIEAWEAHDKGDEVEFAVRKKAIKRIWVGWMEKHVERM
jgi:hypothetical protein